MKTLSFLLAIAALMLTGCVSTRTLDLSDERAVAKVNARASSKKATVTFNTSDQGSVLVDGRWVLAEDLTMKARRLRVAQDSISWLDSKTGALQTYPVQDIETVRFKNPERGLLIGASVGALIGASGGALITSSDDGSGFLSVGAVIRAFGTLGGLLGFIIGVQAGEDVYRIQATPALPEDPPISAVYYPPHRKASPVPHRKR